MKDIDAEIWDYIDGTISENQKATIKAKIASNPDYKRVYDELMEINGMMHATTLEEPSMSFTRNVMEQVKLEMPPVALKTKVDPKIIYGIAAFFVLSILSIFIYAIANSSARMQDFKLPSFKMALNVGQFITPASIRIFLFIDVVIALICLDSFLRSKKTRDIKLNKSED